MNIRGILSIGGLKLWLSVKSEGCFIGTLQFCGFGEHCSLGGENCLVGGLICLGVFKRMVLPSLVRRGLGGTNLNIV